MTEAPAGARDVSGTAKVAGGEALGSTSGEAADAMRELDGGARRSTSGEAVHAVRGLDGARRSLALAIGLSLLSACELAPLDVTGLRCDDARPCGEGFECIEAVCVSEDALLDAGTDAGPRDAGARDAGVDAGVDGGTDAGFDGGTDAGVDAGPPDAGLPRGLNLLANPGFESVTSDGGVSQWRATTGRLLASAPGHAGNRAARVQSTAFQQQMVMVPNSDVPGAELGMLFCGSLWLRSDSDAGVDLTLTIRDRFFDGGTATSSGSRVTVRNTWVQVKEEYASIGVSTIQFRLTANSRFDGGDGVYVDDAWLSVADIGGCPP